MLPMWKFVHLKAGFIRSLITNRDQSHIYTLYAIVSR